jgi:hypothetical protein
MTTAASPSGDGESIQCSVHGLILLDELSLLTIYVKMVCDQRTYRMKNSYVF